MERKYVSNMRSIPNLQNLPPEILCHILKFVSPKDCVNLRSTSKLLNVFSCKELESQDRPKIYLDPAKIEKLHNYLKTSNFTIPPTYLIAQVDDSITIFLKEMGPKIKKLRSRDWPQREVDIPEILAMTPNVEKLWIQHVAPKIDPIIFPLDGMFNKLRILYLHVRTSSPEMQIIKFQVIWDIVAHAPILQEVEGLFYFPLQDAKYFLSYFLEFLQKSSLSGLSIGIPQGLKRKHPQSVTRNSWTNMNGKLSLYWERSRSLKPTGATGGSGRYGCLKYLKFEIGAEDPLPFAVMHHLEILILRITSLPDICTFQPAKFPSLKRVSLHFGSDFTIRAKHPFRSGIFPSVEILSVDSPGTTTGMNTTNLWHKIFPNLKSFIIYDAQVADLDYICTYLRNLESLQLVLCDPVTNTQLQLYKYLDTQNQLEAEWPFARLKSLKKFEIGGPCQRNMPRICHALFYWTISKKMQSLEYLGIYDLEPDSHMRTYRDFSVTSWHKEISVNRPVCNPTWSNI